MAQNQRAHKQSGESLMTRLREGDQTAFRDLYLLYYKRLMQYGCSIEANRDLVHDAIQEFFVWFLQNPQQVKKIENLDTYLFKSLRRNVRALVSQERQNHRRVQMQAMEEGTTTPSSEAAYIEEEQHLFRREWLLKQIGRLPAHQQEVIFLRFFENFDYDDIAEIFSVSNQVVRNTIFRAMRNLRKNANRLVSLWMSGFTFLFLYLSL